MPANSFTQSLIIEAQNKASPALDAASKSAQTAAGQFDNTGKAMEAAGSKTATTTSKFTSFGQTMQKNVGSITAVTGSAWALFNAFDDMEKKVLAVERLQTRANDAARRLADGQAKLTKISRESGTGSAEYAKQLAVVNSLQDKAKQTAERASIAQGDLQESYVQLGMTAGPMAAALGGSTAQLIGGLQKAKPAADAVGKATQAMGGSMNAAGTASKGLLATLGPIGIALAAVAALFVLYQTNAFGFRDSVNEVAKAVVGAAQNILGIVQSVGQQISNFLMNFMKDIVAGNIPAAIKNIGDMIMGIFTETIKPTFDAVLDYLMGILNQVVTAFRGPVEIIKNAVVDAMDFIFEAFGGVGQALADAFAALSSGDIMGALTAISDAFEELATLILDALTTLFTEDIPALLADLTTMFMEEGARWLDVITEVIDGIIDAFTELGALALDSLMTGLGDIGGFFEDLLGDISAQISLWDWDAAWKSVQDAFNSTIDTIRGGAVWLLDKLWQILTSVNWAGVFETLRNAFQSAVEFIYNTASGIATAVINFFKNANWADTFTSLHNAFNSTIEFIYNTGKGIATAIVNFIKNASWADSFTSLQNAFQSTIEFIYNTGKGIAGAIVNFIKNASWADSFASLQAAFESSVQFIYNTGKGIGGAIVGFIRSAGWEGAFSALATGFGNIVNNIYDIAKGVAMKIAGFMNSSGLTTAFSGLAIGFGKTVNEIYAAAQGIGTTIKGFFTQFNWTDTFTSLKNAATAVVDTVVKAFQSINTDAITKALQGLADAFKVSKEEAEIFDSKMSELEIRYGLVVKKTEEQTEAEKKKNQAMKESEFLTLGVTEKMQGLLNVSAAYQGVLTETGNKLKNELVDGLIKTATELTAQRTLWADLTREEEENMRAIQNLILANIDVKQSITDANFANHLFLDGMIKGKQGVKEFMDSIVTGRGEFQATQSALKSLAEETMGTGKSFGWSQEQLRQFIGVVEGSPTAILKLVDSINSLTQTGIDTWFETVHDQVKDGTSKTEGAMKDLVRVFSDINISDQMPEEIKRIMGNTLESFMVGQKRVQSVADNFGPLISSSFAQAASSLNFSDLQRLGPQAAAEIEKGFNGAVPPVLQRVVELLKNPPGNIQEGLPWIQQIITEFENAKAPMAGFIEQFTAAGGQIESIAPKLAGAAEGMDSLFAAMDTGGDAAENLKLKVADLNKVTLDNGQQFAQINGQMVELKPAAEGAASGLDTTTSSAVGLSQEFAALGTHIAAVIKGINAQIAGIGGGTGTKGILITVNADINPAATRLQELVRTIASIQGMVKVDADINLAGQKLQSLVATMQSLRAKPIPITVDTSAATKAVSTLASQITSQLTRASQQAASRIATMAKPFPGIGSAASNAANKMGSAFTSAANKAISAVNRLRSAVNSLPNIRRTITYTNRVPSPPRVNDIHRDIVYHRRVVGAVPRATGFTGEVSQPTLLMVGEQGRERVSVQPINTGIGAPGMGGTKGGYSAGGGGGGNGPAIFKGDVILDGHKVGRVMGRLIAENNV